jgi:multidrug efflux pump
LKLTLVQPAHGVCRLHGSDSIVSPLPLVLAQGARAEMRRALGVAVFSGMLGVTFFGIFLTPVFIYVIQWFARRKTPVDKPTELETPH